MSAILKFDETIKKLSNVIANYGYDSKSLEHFINDIEAAKRLIPIEQLELIQNSYEKYWEIIKEGALEQESELELNKRHLKKYLNNFGLKIGNKFDTTIQAGHIIEVYAKNHQQLFRSTNFFQLSSYNLETLTFIPWDRLFHRKESDTENLLKWSRLVVENSLEVIKPNNTKHILTEIETDKKFSYELDRIGCLTDEFTNLPIGYITTIIVKEVTDNIDYLH